MDGTAIAEKSESHVGRFFLDGQCILGESAPDSFLSNYLFSLTVFHKFKFLAIIPFEFDFQQSSINFPKTLGL